MVLRFSCPPTPLYHLPPVPVPLLPTPCSMPGSGALRLLSFLYSPLSPSPPCTPVYPSPAACRAVGRSGCAPPPPCVSAACCCPSCTPLCPPVPPCTPVYPSPAACRAVGRSGCAPPPPCVSAACCCPSCTPLCPPVPLCTPHLQHVGQWGAQVALHHRLASLPRVAVLPVPPSIPLYPPVPPCTPHLQHAGQWGAQVALHHRLASLPRVAVLPVLPSVPLYPPVPLCTPHLQHAGQWGAQVALHHRLASLPRVAVLPVLPSVPLAPLYPRVPLTCSMPGSGALRLRSTTALRLCRVLLSLAMLFSFSSSFSVTIAGIQSDKVISGSFVIFKFVMMFEFSFCKRHAPSSLPRDGATSSPRTMTNSRHTSYNTKYYGGRKVIVESHTVTSHVVSKVGSTLI